MHRDGFLDKTLMAVSNAAQQSLFSEAFSQAKGLLQSLDVRIKLVTFLIILVVISLLRTPRTLLFVCCAGLVLALLSRVAPLFYLKRVWLLVPLVTAAFVLPSLLNIVSPGETLVVLAKFETSRHFGTLTFPSEITITRQGLWGAIILVSRVGASLSFAMLFTLTTRWSDVFSGLRALFVPRVFVITLSMTYRYLFVLLRLIQDMYRARKSRTIRPFTTGRERSWTATRIGITFKKSMDMSEDIYLAMLARGFHGEFPTMDRFSIAPRDLLWTTGVLAACALLVLIDRSILTL